MTPQLPRVYTYKITFEEVPYYYYGWHKERKYEEEYLGSPVTHKWCWEFYTPKKQILEIFEYSDEGCLKAQEVEKSIIKEFMNSDSRCLNANYGGLISMEAMIKGGRIGGKLSGIKAYELGLGIHGLSKEERVQNSKIAGKIAGKKTHELCLGIHGLSKEERVQNSKKTHELGLGIHAQTQEERIEYAKKGGKIIGEKLSKNFTLVSPTGEVISGRNIRQFCRDYNLNQTRLSRVINGQANSHKGYRRLESVPVPKVA